jgi:hypothetical protein
MTNTIVTIRRHGGLAELAGETFAQNVDHDPAFIGPVLFLERARNSWIGESLQSHHAEAHPDGRVAVLPDAGHDMFAGECSTRAGRARSPERVKNTTATDVCKPVQTVARRSAAAEPMPGSRCWSACMVNGGWACPRRSDASLRSRVRPRT